MTTTSNVFHLRRSYTIKCRPTGNDVLRLLHQANDATKDPVQTYGNLMTAMLLSARMVGLDADAVVEHVKKFSPSADAAITQRPDIFGGAANTNGGK